MVGLPAQVCLLWQHVVAHHHLVPGDRHSTHSRTRSHLNKGLLPCSMCQAGKQAGGLRSALDMHMSPACRWRTKHAGGNVSTSLAPAGVVQCKDSLVLALWRLAALQPQHVHQRHLLTAVQQLLPRGNQRSRRRWRLSCAHNTCPSTTHTHHPSAAHANGYAPPSAGQQRLLA